MLLQGGSSPRESARFGGAVATVCAAIAEDLSLNVQIYGDFGDSGETCCGKGPLTFTVHLRGPEPQPPCTCAAPPCRKKGVQTPLGL
jgi:hypothetical protein